MSGEVIPPDVKLEMTKIAKIFAGAEMIAEQINLKPMEILSGLIGDNGITLSDYTILQTVNHLITETNQEATNDNE